MNTKNSAAIHDKDVDDTELSYKPFYPLALVALAMATVSLMGLGFPVLVILSAVAAFFAIVAIRQIGSPSEYSGMSMARFALFLAVLAATMSMTFKYGRAWYIRSTARHHADQVVDLVMEGRYSEAWAYGTNPDNRPPAGTDLVEYYKQTDRVPGLMLPPKAQLNIFKTVPPVSVLVKDQQQGTMQYVGYKTYPREDPFYEQVACDYYYVPAHSGDPPTMFRIVLLRRDYKSKGGIQWRFRRWEPLDGQAERMVEVPIAPSEPKDQGPKAED